MFLHLAGPLDGETGRRVSPQRASWLPKLNHLPGRLAVERGGDLTRDAGGGGAARVIVQMGVARRGRRVTVTEDRSQHRQPEIGRYAHAGEAVPVMPSSA